MPSTTSSSAPLSPQHTDTAAEVTFASGDPPPSELKSTPPSETPAVQPTSLPRSTQGTFKTPIGTLFSDTLGRAEHTFHSQDTVDVEDVFGDSDDDGKIPALAPEKAAKGDKIPPSNLGAASGSRPDSLSGQQESEDSNISSIGSQENTYDERSRRGSKFGSLWSNLREKLTPRTPRRSHPPTSSRK